MITLNKSITTIYNCKLSIGVNSSFTYATLNSANAYYATLSNGDLTAVMQSAQQGTAKSTIPLIGNKYFEVHVDVAASPQIGIITLADYPNIPPTGDCYILSNNGNTWNAGVPSMWAGYTTYTTGDIISVIFNGSSITFWKNGIDVNGGAAYTGITGTYYAVVNSQYNTDQFTINFGATPFTYTPPVGYTGLYN